MRPVCLGCKQEMKRTRLGIFVRTGRGRFLSGDEFVCPGCGARIAADFAKSEFSSLHDNVKFEACLMTKVLAPDTTVVLVNSERKTERG